MRPHERDKSNAPVRHRQPQDILHELARSTDHVRIQVLRFYQWLATTPDAALQIIDELSAEFQRLRSELTRLTELREVSDRRHDELCCQLQDAESELARVRAQLEQAEAELSSARQRHAELIANQPSRDSLVAQLAAAHAEIEQLKKGQKPLAADPVAKARDRAVKALAAYKELAEGYELFAGYLPARHLLTANAWRRAVEAYGENTAQYYWLDFSFYDLLLHLRAETLRTRQRVTIAVINDYLFSLLPEDNPYLTRRSVSHPSRALYNGLHAAGILKDGRFNPWAILPYLRSLETE